MIRLKNYPEKTDVHLSTTDSIISFLPKWSSSRLSTSNLYHDVLTTISRLEGIRNIAQYYDFIYSYGGLFDQNHIYIKKYKEINEYKDYGEPITDYSLFITQFPDSYILNKSIELDIPIEKFNSTMELDPMTGSFILKISDNKFIYDYILDFDYNLKATIKTGIEYINSIFKIKDANVLTFLSNNQNLTIEPNDKIIFNQQLSSLRYRLEIDINKDGLISQDDINNYCNLNPDDIKNPNNYTIFLNSVLNDGTYISVTEPNTEIKYTENTYTFNQQTLIPKIRPEFIPKNIFKISDDFQIELYFDGLLYVGNVLINDLILERKITSFDFNNEFIIFVAENKIYIVDIKTRQVTNLYTHTANIDSINISSDDSLFIFSEGDVLLLNPVYSKILVDKSLKLVYSYSKLDDTFLKEKLMTHIDTFFQIFDLERTATESTYSFFDRARKFVRSDLTTYTDTINDRLAFNRTTDYDIFRINYPVNTNLKSLELSLDGISYKVKIDDDRNIVCNGFNIGIAASNYFIINDQINNLIKNKSRIDKLLVIYLKNRIIFSGYYRFQKVLETNESIVDIPFVNIAESSQLKTELTNAVYNGIYTWSGLTWGLSQFDVADTDNILKYTLPITNNNEIKFKANGVGLFDSTSFSEQKIELIKYPNENTIMTNTEDVEDNNVIYEMINHGTNSMYKLSFNSGMLSDDGVGTYVSNFNAIDDNDDNKIYLKEDTESSVSTLSESSNLYYGKISYKPTKNFVYNKFTKLVKYISQIEIDSGSVFFNIGSSTEVDSEMTILNNRLKLFNNDNLISLPNQFDVILGDNEIITIPRYEFSIFRDSYYDLTPIKFKFGRPSLAPNEIRKLRNIDVTTVKEIILSVENPHTERISDLETKGINQVIDYGLASVYINESYKLATPIENIRKYICSNFIMQTFNYLHEFENIPTRTMIDKYIKTYINPEQFILSVILLLSDPYNNESRIFPFHFKEQLTKSMVDDGNVINYLINNDLFISGSVANLAFLSEGMYIRNQKYTILVISIPHLNTKEDYIWKT